MSREFQNRFRAQRWTSQPQPQNHAARFRGLLRSLPGLAAAFGWLVFGAGVLGEGVAHADDLAETNEIIWSLASEPDLLAKANQLATPVEIFEFVRNEVEFKAYHGARSSSINSFLGRVGNDVDTASTLIAMLRAQGIRSRYAVATVRAPAADVMSWLGIRDATLAASVLDDQGIQHVALSAGNAYIEFEHVWVQAFVPLDEYRAAGPAIQVDCVTTPAECTWVDLVPAFKRRFQKDPASLIDVYNVVPFDFSAYYNALDSSAPAPADGIVRTDKNPLEIHEEEILAYLRTNFPGKTLEDAADDGAIVPERLQLLPESLPFETLTPVQVYDSVASHDATSGVKKWEKRITVALVFNGFPLGFGDASLAEASTQKLTLSLQSTPSSSTLILRLGGVQLVTLDAGSGTVVINGETVTLGAPFDLQLSLDGPPDTTGTGTDQVFQTTYPNLVVGGYYAISTGGETSNFSQVHRAARQLLAANQQFPIVLDPTGVPHVDTNGDGVFTAGVDIPLLDDLQALDALTGGLLFTAQELYFARLRAARDRLQALNHVIAPISGFLGVVSSVHSVEYLGQTAFSVMPGGLLIDMKGIHFNGNWRNDQPAQTAAEHFELFGHIGSSLEHEIWQELTGFDALSTVRGIQFALRDGASLVDAKKNAGTDTLPTLYPAFGYAPQAPVPFQKRESTVFTTQPVTWFPNPDDGLVHHFETLKAQVDLTTPSIQLSRATWDSDNGFDGFVTCYDNLENQLVGLPPNQGIASITYCDGTQEFNITAAQALATHQSKYFAVVNAPANAGLFDFIDKAQGFVPAEFEYRDSPAPVDFHDTPFVQTIRDDLSLRDVNSQWVEYVLPSRRTLGPFFLFTVYLRKQFDAASGALLSQSYAIQNQSNLVAGGGYVNGQQALELTNTNLFNNEVLTDKNLVRTTNNDRITTPSTVDPISTVTGNNYLDETDVVIRGRGLDLLFTRTYNSGSVPNAGSSGSLSPGWTHSYAMRLRSNDYGQFPNADATTAPENFNSLTSSISYTDERGGEMNFRVDDTGGAPSYAITPPTGVFDLLSLDTPAPGHATLRFRNGVEYLFDAQGADLRTPGVSARLERIQDPFGNGIDFTYDAAGHLVQIDDGLAIPARTRLTLGYDASGRLQTLADWTGRIWTYGYDAAGNLASVTDPLSNTVSYQYDPDRGLLTDMILPADRDGDSIGGDVRTSFEYYRNGKTFTNRNALGVGETLDYDLYRKRTRVEDPRGFIQRHFYDSNGLLVKRVQADGAVSFFENTPDLLRFKKTDPLGFTTEFSYLQNDLADGKIDGGPSDTFGNVVLEQDALGGTTETQYEFTLFDQPTSVKDANGAVRTMSYYAADNAVLGHKTGKLAEIRVALLGSQSNVLVQQFTYNPDGTLRRRVEFLDANDPTRTHTTDWTYTDDGLNVSQILETGADGTSRLRTFTSDSLGRKTSETLWRETSPTDSTLIAVTMQFEYDALDRITLVRDPLGNEAVTVYDANGKIQEKRIRAKQPDGSFVVRVVEQRRYDLADRVVGLTDVLGAETLMEYDEAGHLTKQTDPTGASLRFEYDSVGRRTAAIDANGHRAETRYDAAGRVISETDANGNATTFGYDALGRLTSRSDALGNTTTFGYDAVGNQTQTTLPRAQLDPSLLNSAGVSELRTHDELGRVTSVLDAANGLTSFEYDLQGRRTKVTDAKGQVTQFVYDDLGRLVQTIDPVVETPVDARESLVVDAANQVIVRTDRVGNRTEATYDLLGRVTQRRFLPSNTLETRSYDSFGNLASESNPDATYTFSYDTKNRLTSKTDHRFFRSLQFAYDAADRVISKTDYQGDTTEFLYDGAGRLISERNANYVEVSYHFDAGGRLLDRILSNGVHTRYGYDAANRRTSLIQTAADGTVFESVSDQYDANGNVIQRMDSAGTTLYGYDAVNRLISADLPGTSDDRLYAYDGVGNRLFEAIGSVLTAYTVGPGNRLSEMRQGSPSGPLLRSFDYDANGAVTAKRDGSGAILVALGRNDRGEVASVGGAGFQDTFAYDPERHRIRRVDLGGIHEFHLEGDRLESVYDGSGNLEAEYLRGSVIDEVVNGYLHDSSGTALNLTFHHDGVNSVTALSGHTGTVEQTRRYAPFGELLSESGSVSNELGFTGRERDPDSGLYYFRARWYDPEVGRFLSEDPLGFGPGVNFYAYVGNSPVDRRDPSGQCPTCIIGGVIGGVFGGISAGLLPDATFSDVLTGIGVGTVAGAFTGSGAGLVAGGLGLLGVGGTTAAATGTIIVSGGAGAAGSLASQLFTADEVNLALVGASGAGGLISGVVPAIGSAGLAAGTLELTTGGSILLDIAGAQAGLGVDLLAGAVGNELPSIPVQNPFAGSSNAGASGGFVLYPGMANLNSVERVYQK